MTRLLLIALLACGGEKTEVIIDLPPDAQRMADCDAGDGGACFAMGLEAWKADPRKGDQAIAAYRRGCEHDSGSSCQNAAGIIDIDPSLGTQKQSSDFTERCCSLDIANCCYSLGKRALFGRMQVVKDETRAATLLKKACELDHAGGCRDLAAMLQAGTGVAKDEGAAVGVYEDACGLGDGESCRVVGTTIRRGLHGIAADEVIANSWYEKGCSADEALACALLGDRLSKGLGAPADPAQSLKYTDKACDLGHANACLFAGVAHHEGSSTEKSPTKAVDRFDRGCALDSGQSCLNLGKVVRERGEDERAAAATAKACKLGIKEAC